MVTFFAMLTSSFCFFIAGHVAQNDDHAYWFVFFITKEGGTELYVNNTAVFRISLRVHRLYTASLTKKLFNCVSSLFFIRLWHKVNPLAKQFIG